MQLGGALFEYADLPGNRKVAFIREHPELKDIGVIRWALTAAFGRNVMGDKQKAGQIALAAFELAGELQNYAVALEAVTLLAKIIQETGLDDYAAHWSGVATALQHVLGAGNVNAGVSEMLADTINRMERNSSDFKKASEILTSTAQTLVFMKKNAIGGLLDSLSSKQTKVELLSILYLGMLNDEGVDTTGAIEHVRRLKDQLSNSKSPAMQTVQCALAMMGDQKALEVRSNYMKMHGIVDVQAYNRDCIGMTIAQLIS